MALYGPFVDTVTELKALTSAERAGAGAARVLVDPAGDASLPPGWYFFVLGASDAESAPSVYRSDDDAGAWFQNGGAGGGGSPTGAAGGDLTGTYPNPTIANLAVTGPKIASDAVTASKIANNAVTTAKIADSNVTTAKLADSAVTTAKIADGAITAEKLAPGVGGGGASVQFALLQEQKPAETDNGDSPSAGNLIRVQNTEVYDPGGIVNLGVAPFADYFRIASPGTYVLKGWASLWVPSGVLQQCRCGFASLTGGMVYGQQGATVQVLGSGANGVQTTVEATAVIVTTGANVNVRLTQFFLEAVTGGTGKASLTGITEVYSEVQVLKIA